MLRFDWLQCRPSSWPRTNRRRCLVPFCCVPLSRKTETRPTGWPSGISLRYRHFHRPPHRLAGFSVTRRLCTIRSSAPAVPRPYIPKLSARSSALLCLQDVRWFSAFCIVLKTANHTHNLIYIVFDRELSFLIQIYFIKWFNLKKIRKSSIHTFSRRFTKRLSICNLLNRRVQVKCFQNNYSIVLYLNNNKTKTFLGFIIINRFHNYVYGLEYLRHENMKIPRINRLIVYYSLNK